MDSKGKCIHCLQSFDDLTRDHVFPSSWYPASTPLDVQRWTVPSCLACNKKHGENEEELFLKLGVCLQAKTETEGVIPHVMRVVDPNAGIGSRDKAARLKKRDELLQDVLVHKEPPTAGVFPNFGKLPGVEYTDYPVLHVEVSKLAMLGEKIARGVNYKVKKKLIGQDQYIHVFFSEDSDMKEISESIRDHGKTIEFGPGFVVGTVDAADTPDTTFFAIQIWGKLKISVAVVPAQLKNKLLGIADVAG